MNRRVEAPSLPQETRWLQFSHAYGVLVAVLLGYFLLRIPIQVFDCFTDMLALLQPMEYLVRDAFRLPSYLRPGRWVFQKAVFEVANGEYFLAFRLTQALQVLLVIVLFVRLVRPATASAARALPLGLAVLVGSHTFAWTVREAFPINHFLTIVLCCVAAANVAFARPRWWTDLLAAALFIAAAGTLESGLLVWVIFVGGYVVGLRGVSHRGLAVLTALLAGYFFARFVVFDVGIPGLELRDAGFGFARYDAADLVRMFGGNALVFYAYNVLASIFGVLFAEPRHGVWSLTHSIVRGAPHPALLVNVVTNTLATLLLVRFGWTRRHAWMRRAFDRRDQLVLLFVIVLAANAVMSYPYTKDAIMSPAGLFFAAATFVACVDLIETLPRPRRTATAAAVLILAALSAGWAVRFVGLHAALDRTAFVVRQQWTRIDELVPLWYDTLTPRELALKQQLQEDAIRRFRVSTFVREEWVRLFDVE
jgi:hypothetical protein